MEVLYILRHGIAEDISSSGSDQDRILTTEGQTKTKKISKLFNSIEKELSLVLSSPYARAKETAEILVSTLEVKPKLEIVNFLAAGASAQDISKGLIPHRENKNIMLVGHNPDLEIFMSKLIGAKNIKLKKGALAKIILNSSYELSGELEWLITSKIAKNTKD